ncbi:MAG: 30S ribosomal protein S3 [Candidatus Diapherotrites archaeon]|nr:30S ribosomal protein S3 [Candidatus Diapherotrites archaeon]
MIEKHFIQQGLKKMMLEKYLEPELRSAGFIGVDVVKTPIATRVIIIVTRPGIAIGKKGKAIKNLTKELEEKFGYENPQIEVQGINNPELNAKACVDRIKTLIEKGYSWRSVVYRVVEDAISNGAQGIEVVLQGVLAGKGNRAKHERIAKGYMKKAGEQAYLVDYAKGVAVPKIGAIGIKVRIIRPGIVFPDKRKISDIVKGKVDVKDNEKVIENKEGVETKTESENTEVSEKPKIETQNKEGVAEEVKEEATELVEAKSNNKGVPNESI